MKDCPSLTHHNEQYDDESILTLILIPTYRTHPMDAMLFHIDTGAHISCIGNETLKKIIFKTGRTTIPLVRTECDFSLGDTTMCLKRDGGSHATKI